MVTSFLIASGPIFPKRPVENVIISSQRLSSTIEIPKQSLANKVLGDEYKVKKVDLRNSADFGRFSYKDFNDTKVFFADGNGTPKKIQVDGTKFGDSTIKQCDNGKDKRALCTIFGS